VNDTPSPAAPESADSPSPITAGAEPPSPTPVGAEPPVSFPRLSARTLRFTLGEPRNITVTGDGSRVLFVRTPTGTSRIGCLWSFDVDTATERLLVDPADLLGGAGEDLSPEERSRRERARESGAGIVGYTVDESGSTAAFALSGGVWACDLATGRTSRVPTTGTAIDPRIDPTGRRIGYATAGSLRVTELDGTADRTLAEPDGDEIVWGQAEFVAAEEMDRYRGFWWAPDGESVLAERYDNSPVGVWYMADPANPAAEPVPHRYPAAGTADASVQLWHLRLDGTRAQIPWDDAAFPYLTRVSWTAGGGVIQVMSRDQRRGQVLRVHLDGAAPVTSLLAEPSDPVWVDLVPGVPALSPDGRLVTCVDDAGTADGAGTRRLAVGGSAVTPAGMQVREVLSVTADGVLATISTEPTEQQLVRAGYDGQITALSRGSGVHTGAVGGGTAAVLSSRLDLEGSAVTVLSGGREVGRLRRVAESPGFTPTVTMLTVGARELRAAVLFPRSHRRGSARLPVLMAPYGGPHAQLVRASSRMFLQAQWLADQGFAVVVADGRGTPGRGPAWERAVRDELASVTLADQVDALAGVAERYPDDLDTGRVGIMGWSYGGYLSALAVLDRPDVFHAAVAGAPVTDWSLYDTYYTERYLGHPAEQPEVYRRNSLIDRASRLTRPLLIIHGMVDDNVVVAHTLRLSAALLAAGRPHQVLPLTGVTHMASAEDIAENLLLAQVHFLRAALGGPSGS
jgi:dipeptidyl-peptidase-4